MKFLKQNKIPTLLLFLSLTGKTLGSKESLPKTEQTKAITATWLTITKVKKPWIAWRGLVSSRMEKSIPEYQAIPGLEEKFYSFREGSDRFGGIYFWRQKSDAERWFQVSWFERIEKQYGEKGIVESYSIVETYVHPNLPSLGENVYAVLSYRNIDIKTEFKKDESLHSLIRLQDANKKTCFLTIWKDEKSALSNFNEADSDELYFIPVYFRK
ncbi:MAG: hypothetical protein O9301_08660 [Leptospira sp.]|nr:hypothetical protein [Leptospira sp.]